MCLPIRKKHSKSNIKVTWNTTMYFNILQNYYKIFQCNTNRCNILNYYLLQNNLTVKYYVTLVQNTTICNTKYYIITQNNTKHNNVLQCNTNQCSILNFYISK